MPIFPSEPFRMPSILRFPAAAQTEWVGGRYTLPKKVREGGDLIDLDVVLWLELPSGLIVGSTIIDPRDPRAFAQTLEETLKQPAHGSPRQPMRIRVPDARLAAELRDSGIPVVVAPVPELDDAFADLSAAMSDAGPPELSYLGDGSIAPEVVARLFTAAGMLFRTAPWRRVEEHQVVRVDIPALGVDGACLSVIGGAGESFGLLLFRSIDVYRAFANAGPSGPSTHSGSGRALLSLSFDRKKEVPPELLHEIEKYRWPVEGSKAYPVVISLDNGMSPLPLTELDYRTLTACTLAFVSFYARHAGLFESPEIEPVCESFTGDDEITVTLTAPHGAEELFDLAGFFADEEPAPAVGRNDPCPCGSGRKYKKCHLDSDETPRRQTTEDATVHELDFHLVREIGRFAHKRFGPGWYGDEIEADEALLTLFLPWIAWTAAVDGRRVADLHLEQNAGRFSPAEREWYAAQKNGWLSVWEVTGVQPGRVAVRDLLTGEQRSVSEEMASQSLVARDVILARIVDFRGTSYFAGLYARSLAPSEADRVVRAVRSKLRMREGTVATEPLRAQTFGRFMIEEWVNAVREHDDFQSRPPDLRNTDGDPLRFVTESFRFVEKSRREILKRLAAMDGAERTADGNEIHFFRIGASGRRKRDRTVIGRAIVEADTLRLETNSERRADALGRRVRDACAGLIKRVGRTFDSPSLGPAAGPAEPMSGEEQALAREYKERHYRDWLDTPLPALGGKTPRAAARSAKSRETLDLLLRDMENRENRLPPAARFDFRQIRRELALNDT